MTTQDLPAKLSRGVLEKQALIEALRNSDGNQTQAAKILGVSRITVWKRMKKHGLSLD